MKTAAQEQRAIAERQANVVAQAAGLPLPHPNEVDALMPRLQADATWAEKRAWHHEVHRLCAP
ncbi:MAG: hypothetical protein JKY37_23135 [Nannocystaceae bacterium]|nr:hypothetical protein [Nannocystaceae bacterium]